MTINPLRLTVAIPTYNRPEQLRRSVSLLLDQLTPECELLILDNCSPVPVSEVLAGLIRANSGPIVRIIRHAANVGGNANFLRCFESAGGEWLWTLGDDDPPFPDAVDRVLREIDRDPACIYINFSCPTLGRGGPRTSDAWATGASELVAAMDTFDNLLSISAGVWRTAAFMGRLRVGYEYCYSQAPQLALLLTVLGPDKRCRLSAATLFDNGAPEGGLAVWSYSKLALTLGTLLDLPLSDATRQALAHKMCVSVPSLRWLVTELLVSMARGRMSRGRARYILCQLKSRLYYYGPGAGRLAGLMHSGMVALPGPALWLLRSRYRLFYRHPLPQESRPARSGDFDNPL